ncbi:TetR/AcrR family transcriptional regulator [Phenylobacterium sp. LjRoot219]|uniref:TetR/AcrR family transcriptional regulator n=1 Tax=Phenylobacterium sp. LjRoot219 TaxID=3342283 RepID=UPI003ED12774
MSETPRPRNRRDLMAQERREAVLEAALAEFIAHGFAATRIEDVARRAEVAKGTVYLHFKDKEALFAAAIRAEMAPVAAAMAALLEDDVAGPKAALEAVLTALLQRLAETRTGDVIRLIMSETIRFPEATRFYREEIVVPMLRRVSALLQRARAAGELRTAGTADFPQLVIAPLMLVALARDFDLESVTGPTDELLQVHLGNLFN